MCSPQIGGREPEAGQPGAGGEFLPSHHLLQRHRRLHHHLRSQHAHAGGHPPQRPLHALRRHHRQIRRLQGNRLGGDRLLGLVVKASHSDAAGPGSISNFPRGVFPQSSHSSDLKIGTPLATLPGTGCYRVSAGTGWPGVSIL